MPLNIATIEGVPRNGSELFRLRSRYPARGGQPITQAMFAAWLGIEANSFARLERDVLRLRLPLARLCVYTLSEHVGVSLDRIRRDILARRQLAARYRTLPSGKGAPAPQVLPPGKTSPSRQRSRAARRSKP